MNEFQSLADSPKHHSVLTDDIAGPERLDPDFCFGALADHTFSCVYSIFIKISFQGLGNDLCHLHSCPTGGILL